MASLNQNTAATSPSANNSKGASKSSKPSKRIVLSLPSSALAKFSPAQPNRKASRAKQAASAANPLPEEKPPEPETKQEDATESNDTPTASNPPEEDGSSNAEAKRKGVPGPKPGLKRSAPTPEANGAPKTKGKPGPKRRKIEGEINGNGKPNGTTSSIPHHKLGPKANTGAINAGLRALDRTGKPCRRWQKQGFNLKSFTGVAWSLPYWQTPSIKAPELTGDVKSETTGSSDAKPGPDSSMLGSDNGQGNKEGTTPADATAADTASSPAPTASAVDS